MAALHAAAMTTPPPWSEAEFAALLAAPGTFAMGDARAFALGRVVLDEAELLTLATHPLNRRTGLARAALAAFESAARTRGAATALLEVAADNAPAIALYDTCRIPPHGTAPGLLSRPRRTPRGCRADGESTLPPRDVAQGRERPRTQGERGRKA
jgi:[ribosomal protein S18]-alanine N-acetyltransferase